MTGADTDLINYISEIRAEIEETIKTLSFASVGRNGPQADVREIEANLNLSYRHLEDAKMRLGKVIQAIDDATYIV